MFITNFFPSTQQIKNLTNRGRNLGILDFFGFESLERNSFEQMNINYCCERIHQSYIQIVLKNQQDLYVREGLEWTKIDFYDNLPICEMMDKVKVRWFPFSFFFLVNSEFWMKQFKFHLASLWRLLSYGRAESR